MLAIASRLLFPITCRLNTQLDINYSAIISPNVRRPKAMIIVAMK